MGFNLFETRKPRQFKYEPRYNDPVKEAERKKKWEEEGNTKKLNELRRIRLQDEWKLGRRKQEKDKLNKKLLIYVIIAAAILAFIMLFPVE